MLRLQSVTFYWGQTNWYVVGDDGASVWQSLSRAASDVVRNRMSGAGAAGPSTPDEAAAFEDLQRREDDWRSQNGMVRRE